MRRIVLLPRSPGKHIQHPLEMRLCFDPQLHRVLCVRRRKAQPNRLVVGHRQEKLIESASKYRESAEAGG